MEDMKNPEFQRILEQLGQDGSAFGAGGGEGAPGDDLGMDESLASTLQMLAKMSMTPGMEPEAAEAMGEEVLKKMTEEFSRMGSKDDASLGVENMMKQLLSKEIMYVPLQQTCEKVRPGYRRVVPPCGVAGREACVQSTAVLT